MAKTGGKFTSTLERALALKLDHMLRNTLTNLTKKVKKQNQRLEIKNKNIMTKKIKKLKVKKLKSHLVMIRNYYKKALI